MTRSSHPVTPERVWVRAPTKAYARCLRSHGGGDPDPRAAVVQHQGYVAALHDAGIDVEVVPPAEPLPDACFVEDGAVVLGDRVVMTRPGAQARRAELPSLETALAGHLAVQHLEAPGTLDGGDVMRMGDRLFVGRSARTNDTGIEQLRALASEVGLEVVPVAVPDASLHLKSVCSALDDRRVVVDATALPPAVLSDLGLTVHEVPEPAGANVLCFGDRVLVSADAPRTAAWLCAEGFTVVEVPLGEFHRGDGALSCLSLRLPPPGQWSV